jgi:F0F1-type ATP synthase assembly protein I
MPSPQQPLESSRALGAGMTFAVTVALFAWGGVWLDKTLSTSPWLVLTCTLLGVLGGTIHMIYELAPGTLGMSRKPPRKDEKNPPS